MTARSNRILVVEDEPLVADFLVRGLTAEGFKVTLARDGSTGEEQGHSGDFDVILLDWMLPGKSGRDVCSDLRGAGVTTPILMLTARDAVPERVEGLRAGADDYLVKPYAFEELLARIDALTRRGRRDPSNGQKKLTYRDVEFDRSSLKVSRAGQPLHLTPKEIGILELLLVQPGHVVTRETILRQVWDMQSDPLTNIVDVYVGRLRRKLESHGDDVVETIRGFGYRLR
jgi:DNA-binding response OmpR family regulator